MRAAELLSAISKPVFTDNFQGLYVEKNTRLLPISGITKQGDTLIFSADPKLAPVTMKDLLKALMLNKRCDLFIHNGKETTRVYGYKEVEHKIVL